MHFGLRRNRGTQVALRAVLRCSEWGGLRTVGKGVLGWHHAAASRQEKNAYPECCDFETMDERHDDFLNDE